MKTSEEVFNGKKPRILNGQIFKICQINNFFFFNYAQLRVRVQDGQMPGNINRLTLWGQLSNIKNSGKRSLLFSWKFQLLEAEI